MATASTGSQSEIEILEDEDEPPTEEQVLEYAEYLGMDVEAERHLLWIAREGVAAPVPKPWKTCTEKGEVFYFNFETEESSWDHPCDGHYRKLLEKHRHMPKDEEGIKASKEKDPSAAEQDEKKSADGRDEVLVKQDEDEDASFVSDMVGSESEASSRKALDSGAAWSDSSAGSVHSAHSSDGGAADPRDKDLPAPAPEAAPLGASAETSKASQPESRGVGLGGSKENVKGLDPEPPSSNISEVSEDFRSDWGAPSPLGSGAGGLSREAQSLEVSTSGDAGSLSGAASILADRPQTCSPAHAVRNSVKIWASLHADLASLREVLTSASEIREQQAALLRRLKS